MNPESSGGSVVADMTSYLPILLAIFVAVGLGIAMVTINWLLGPKRRNRTKDQTFECGNPPQGSARDRFSIKYYLVAIVFLVFDVEIIFILPWVVKYREFLQDPAIGLIGLAEVLFFVFMLFLTLVYVWRSRALDWK
jgi:NADH-quinone oxidoreductase subunit A